MLRQKAVSGKVKIDVFERFKYRQVLMVFQRSKILIFKGVMALFV